MDYGVYRSRREQPIDAWRRPNRISSQTALPTGKVIDRINARLARGERP